MYFSKLTHQFLLTCFQVHMSKISAKSDKFWKIIANYFKVHFLSRHSV